MLNKPAVFIPVSFDSEDEHEQKDAPTEAKLITQNFIGPLHTSQLNKIFEASKKQRRYERLAAASQDNRVAYYAWDGAGWAPMVSRAFQREIIPVVTFLTPLAEYSSDLKGSIGHAFTVCIRTENENQASFSPFGPHEISVLIELTVGHLRYHLTDVPPQPNSPADCVFRTNQSSVGTVFNQKPAVMRVSV